VADCNTYNLSLPLLSEENELGCKVTDTYEHFAMQICAYKLEAQCQAEEHTKTEVQENHDPQRLMLE
jgi:hypothetical protein